MDLKYISWTVIIISILLNVIGFFGCVLLLFAIVAFVLGFLAILYLQYESLDKFFEKNMQSNPLDKQKILGLNLACDKKPILIISPDIKVQTESKKHKPIQDHRKKSLIDSGIEMIFKKNAKSIRDNQMADLKFRPDIILDTKDAHLHDDKKWKPFETIKIYTERRKSHDSGMGINISGGSGSANVGSHKQGVNAEGFIHFGEECTNPALSKLSYDSNPLDEHGSPKRKTKTILSGIKQIDQLIHTIIDYILRDYIDSWFCSLTDNKEFSEYRTRISIEDSIQNVCKRIKSTQWIPLISTKLIDNIATHARLYRLATQSISNDTKESKQKLSPQKRIKKDQHRRNKSDTDLSWYLGNASVQKNVANSKFYTGTASGVDENTLIDPEAKLLNAFFNASDLYKNECLSDTELEKYLTHVMETVLYFTLPEEDFACLPLRTFLATLIANVVCKPLLEILTDPDLINLQIARLCAKEPPPAEFFIKMIRQCTDLSELRACRQFITKEMDLKFKDTNSSAELSSLKYTQKLIDLRLSYLQSNKSEISKSDPEKPMSNLPILTLDELLTKELALSYYLDYLSILNLQKYVIFYLTAQEWKLSFIRCMSDLQMNKNKSTKEDMLKTLRDRANSIYKEYLISPSTNCLNIDQGLIEAISIKIRNEHLIPESNWFDSICKYVYEKLKNEDVFLNHFYQSSAYKKLLLELDCIGQNHEPIDIESNLSHINLNFDTGSDSNSGDIPYDDEPDDEPDISKISTAVDNNLIKTTYDLSVLPLINNTQSGNQNQFLDVANFKHSRSHSDCTGLQNMTSITVGNFEKNDATKHIDPDSSTIKSNGEISPRVQSAPSTRSIHSESISTGNCSGLSHNFTSNLSQQKLSAKIINTAIHCEGQYAVYAIQVTAFENNQHKSWHIYRRYSKFLELKKLLVKKYSNISQIPFPAKKAFQNTQRSVLEHRMVVLNEFLCAVCVKAENCDDIMQIMRNFMEPDTNDRKIQGGSGIRTIETLVNPFKSGMRTIINMPDTLVGGIMKILLGKGPMKEASFLDVTPIHLEQSSEYPALTSVLNLLDEVFDLQARSQWLRRGIINRLLGAPWVSHAANKKIVHAAKSLIEVDKIEHLLSLILNSIWPNGKQQKKVIPREDNTKLRTRMAAKTALFAFMSDDLKHVVGSETTRYGLLNFFSMLQNRKLNRRLVLVLLNDILTTLYRTESMTKHVKC